MLDHQTQHDSLPAPGGLQVHKGIVERGSLGKPGQHSTLGQIKLAD